MSFVYFIGCQNTAGELRVKIGFTRRHPTARRDDFQPGSPEELDVLAYVPGGLDLERKLHETFASVRLHNEWFMAVGCLETLVRRLMIVGGGARRETPYETFKLAMFECVYDVIPDRVPDGEDYHFYEATADPDLWDDEFSPEYCRAHWITRP